MLTKCTLNSVRNCWILSHRGLNILWTHHNTRELNARFSRSSILLISWCSPMKKTFAHQFEMNCSSCYKNRVNANSFHLIRGQSFHSRRFQWLQVRFPFFFVCFSLSFLYHSTDLRIFIYSILKINTIYYSF